MKKIITAFFCFVFIILGFISYYYINNNYALKIDKEKISANEYKIYLYEQIKIFKEKGGEDIWETDFDGVSAEDVAKQNAINSIVLVKTAVKQSKELNININNNDINNIKKESDSLFNELNSNIKNNNISKKEVENVITESYIQKKVYQFVTDGFVTSNADFEAYFNNYYEENKKQLNKVDIRYIFISADDENAEQEIEQIYEKILLGESFEQLQSTYSQGENNILNVNNLLDTAVEDAAYSLNENEVSNIIRTNDGFYIIKVIKVDTPDLDTLRKDVEKYYIQKKKQEIYQNQSNSWSSNINIEKNEKLINSIFDDLVEG